MNKLIHKFLHWLGVIIATLIILLAVILSSLPLLSPYLEQHHAEIEALIYNFMQQPVQVGKIDISGSGLEPILRLRDVTIFNDAKTIELFKVNELRIGIDLLGSLLKRKIEFGLLVVRGVKILVYQDETGIRIGKLAQQTIKNTHLPVGLNDMLEWLFTQGSVRLTEIELVYHSAVQDFTVPDLQLSLSSDVLQHNLKLSGKLVPKESKYPIKFNFKLGIKGDILKQENLLVSGFAEIGDMNLNLKFDAPSDFFKSIPFDGDIELYLSNTRLNANKVFRHPILIENFNSRVHWKRNHGSLIIRANKSNLHSDNLILNGDLQLILPATGGAMIDTAMNFDLFDATQAQRFYPINVLDPPVLNWLDRAITGRRASGTMILQGPLASFPFDHHEGKFLITTNLKNINLDYAPNWPPVKDIYGQLIFEGRSMRVVADSAKITDVPLRHIVAVIPDLEKGMLTIDGENITTNANQGLGFIYASPLRDLLGRELTGTNLSGLIKLRLKLIIPLLEDEDQIKINGDLGFANNNLKFSAVALELKKIQGMLHFTEKDLVANDLKAELFSWPVMLNVVTQHDNIPAVNVNLYGRALIADLRSVFTLPFAAQIEGNTKYRMQLQLYSGNQSKNDTLKITSDLRGIDVNLPAPFGKKSDEVRDLSAIFHLGGNNSQLLVNYGDFFVGNLNTQTQDLNLKISKFNWADWENYLAQMGNVGTFEHIVCNIDEFITFGMKFPAVKFDLIASDRQFLINVNSPKIAGQLIVPRDLKNGVVTGTLKKLYLDKTNATTALKAESTVALRLQIDDFRYANKDFGKVMLEIQPQGNAILINRLEVNNQDFMLSAKGKWENSGRNYTTLQGSISSNDAGGALVKFGLTTNLAGGKGGMNYSLGWNGTPDQMNLKTMQGEISLDVKHGRTTNLSKQTESEIEVVRILNILSLPTLPRHLTLDFSDFTKTGFVFDTLQGNLQLKNGSIFTKNISLEGPIADIFIAGRIGVMVQDYDLSLTVVPHLTSSIPVIATITGGPIVGIVTLLGDKLLKAGVQQVMSYGYYVKGTWDKPEVEKLSVGQLAKIARARG